MIERRRRVQQYAKRKQAGRKPISLHGGVSRSTRLKLKSISPQKNGDERGRVTESITGYVTRRFVEENMMRRYASIDRMLDSLRVNSLLKRQAIHAACQKVAHDVSDIVDQIDDYSLRRESLYLKWDLLQNPKQFESHTVLKRAYPIRKNISIRNIDLQINFLSEMIRTSRRELREIYQNPPSVFVSVFGKKSSSELWTLFRDIIYPNNLFKRY